MSLLVRFDERSERAVVGGKGANLGRLIDLGLRVPEAVGVPVEVFQRHLDACRSAGVLDDDALREALVARPLEAGLEAALRAFVQEVGGRVSVRSSGTLEDAHTHAFAGQFLTVLNVGPEAVAQAVRRVWASAFTPTVAAYLERAGLTRDRLGMAVVIQQQIDSEASGVALGDGERVLIEAVFGQGEAVVGAEVVSDHWEVERGRIVATRIARKERALTLPDGPPSGTLMRRPLRRGQCEEPSLTRAQVLAVAALAGRLSDAFEGRPQDCEFSFAGGELFVLQTRDVTASLPVEAPTLGPWTPPGPGGWDLDDGHFARPVSRLFADLFPAPFQRGFKASTARYGVLISHLDYETVNGFCYSRLRPVAAPVDATVRKPPPAFVFKLLSRLVPELRRRIRTARRVWADPPWRRQAEDWELAKRSSIEAHLALQQVDLEALDDPALAAHFHRAVSHATAMIEQHHTYNLAALLPAGDLLAHAARWSRGALAPTDVLSLLSGSAAVSADLRSPDALRFAAAVAKSPAARDLLRLEDPGAQPDEVEARSALEALRRLDDEAGRSAAEFLSHREYRLVEGLDPAAPCFRELPLVLWRTLRLAAQAQAEGPAEEAARGELLERCHRLLPAEHREDFDRLLAEARAHHHLRDERSLYSDVWAWGILRTVCLEIGRRLARRSPPAIVEPADALQATVAELDALLDGGRTPSALELERRSAFQRAYTVRDAPARLGPPAQPPPPAESLPPAVRRVTEALMTVIGLNEPTAEEPGAADATLIAGRPASGGVQEGIVHVVATPRDVESVPKGAVLVVGAGSSTFTMLAPLASAVIAEGGGLLSHVAIVCREYRLPCVCGCTGALGRLRTGDRVRVDGTRGTVTLLATADEARPS